MQKEFFSQDVSEIVRQTKTDINHGLSMSQYAPSKKIHGKNTLSEEKSNRILKIFRAVFGADNLSFSCRRNHLRFLKRIR